MEGRVKEFWERAAAFHGHECPGLAIGVRAALIVMDQFAVGQSKDEELVCVSENDACGVDGIQALLSCTVGKGNLLFRGTGKQAYSFFDRKKGKRLRLCLKPMERQMERGEKIEYILTAPAKDVFTFKEPGFELPEKARIFKSRNCEICGENAPEHKMRFQDGKVVCLDCFRDYQRGWF